MRNTFKEQSWHRKVFLLSWCSIKCRLLFREFFKKIKKLFITFLQILKTRKFKSFKEKFHFFKTQNTLLCLEEKFTKCICAFRSQMKYFIFLLLILPGEFCAYVNFVLIFVHVKPIWLFPVFFKKETQNLIVRK